jgi:hypothetical protein
VSILSLEMAPHNNRMETDVPKSHALCKMKSTMRAFLARGSCGRWADGFTRIETRMNRAQRKKVAAISPFASDSLRLRVSRAFPRRGWLHAAIGPCQPEYPEHGAEV